jgi:hypothetical protein
MSIFQPFVEKMTDPVPVVCPTCKFTMECRDLSVKEKQLLIDLTHYHEVFEEYRHLQTLESLLARYPGTRHPLVVSKLQKIRHGFDHAVAVEAIIQETPGFQEFLKNSSFWFEGRMSFVRSRIQEEQQLVFDATITCPHCPQQYCILPWEYWMRIGL